MLEVSVILVVKLENIYIISHLAEMLGIDRIRNR